MSEKSFAFGRKAVILDFSQKESHFVPLEIFAIIKCKQKEFCKETKSNKHYVRKES